jgi:uncharacterized protein (DUF1330 family)
VPGYVVAQVERITDAAEFEDYRSKVGATIDQYGGKFIVRRSDPEALEGDWPGKTVILEFETVEQARRWYFSDEYKPLLEQRLRCAETRVAIVEGP